MIVVRNFTDDGDYGFITDELLMGRGWVTLGFPRVGWGFEGSAELKR
jgi:hypothetical protein